VILQTTRWAMDLLFDRCWDYTQRGMRKEFISGNNDADGVYLRFWVRRHFPQLEGHIRARLSHWGGNSSGVNIANIDNLGNVHPDTFWWHHRLGNVKERPFSQIWRDTSDPLMAGLKASPRAIAGDRSNRRPLPVLRIGRICLGNVARFHNTTIEPPTCYG
jgi:MoaA/NifB/PqqE/SkfB family radical SAM enzyme